MIDWSEVPGFLAFLFLAVVTVCIAIGVGARIASLITGESPFDEDDDVDPEQ